MAAVPGCQRNLLSGTDTSEYNITVLGRGTGLIGGSIRTKLTREEVHSIFLDGFFPDVRQDARSSAAAALRPNGGRLELCFRCRGHQHLAQFLRQAGKSIGGAGSAIPTHLLLNGGVLQAAAIEQRLAHVLGRWLSETEVAPLTILQNETKQSDLMHAVAHGAAYYGLARTGKGVRIRGGVPRTYYVGIESSMPAVPGMPAPMKALTVVPFGLEEGSQRGASRSEVRARSR